MLLVISMQNIIIAAILIFLVACIIGYLIKAKKRGQTCIGCPYAKQCGSNCSGTCGNNINKN